MRILKRNNLLPVLVILLICLGCDDKVPIKEMALSKYEITRALSVKADKYAPDELNAAKKKLLESHDLIKEDKLEDSQKAAVESHKKAVEAYEKSLPLLARDTIEGAEKNLEAADEAYAKVLAEEEYKQANESLVKANEQFEQKKYYDSYESALNADAQAVQAKNTAISKKSILAEAIEEVKSTLDEASRYSAEKYAPEKYASAGENVQTSESAYQELLLKKGFAAIEIARVEADEAYTAALEGTAREKAEQAKNALAQAEASEGAEIATDELGGAREALGLSESLLAESKYKESIAAAEEALRLSAAVMSTKKPVEVAVIDKDSGTDTEGAETRDQDQVQEDVQEDEDFILYKVKYNPDRRDCLWRIAGKFYNKPLLWKKIYDANSKKINNPHLIWPDMVLKVPRIQKTAVKKQKTEDTVKEEEPAEADSAEEVIEEEPEE